MSTYSTEGVAMSRSIELGELVSFKTNMGRVLNGTVVQRISERKQPVILMIELANGWRCFRMEDEVGSPTSAQAALSHV